jgi:glycosyltransferase involved in cell wall biosynthesis
MNNLHISLTSFKNESRVLKETNSILKHDIANLIYIAALHDQGLAEHEQLQKKIQLRRFRLSSRALPKNLIFQFGKYLEFILRVSSYYHKKNISVVNVHALGLLPLGILLKKWYGARLVYDTHELETETNGSRGFRKKLAKIVERFCISFTDQIFVVSDSIAREYAKMYAIPAPPVVLNCPPYRKPLKSDYFRKHFGIPDDAIIFLYQGGLSQSRGVPVILEAFKQLAHPLKAVVFMGYGVMEEEIKYAARKSSNIFFQPAVPPDVVLEYTASADVGMHFIQNTCLNHYYCLPNKLFEYTMAGLPVIVSNMYEMSNFVRNNHIGVVARDESVAALIDAVSEIAQLNLAEMKRNALAAAEQYNWENQENVMINVYRNLLSGVTQ